MLVIVGTGRSGSTLLGRLLGALPGAVHVGEVRFLWQRGLIEARLCGCGVPVPECPFWRTVLAEAYGARRPDPAAVHARLTSVTRLRRVPSWLIGSRGSSRVPSRRDCRAPARTKRTRPRCLGAITAAST